MTPYTDEQWRTERAAILEGLTREQIVEEARALGRRLTGQGRVSDAGDLAHYRLRLGEAQTADHG